MHLPGMPGGMVESETVLFDGDAMLVKLESGSPFMPSPLPSDAWSRITHAEARGLADETVMPVPMLALMDVNPVVANPLELFATLIDMSALQVLEDTDGAVVLSGAAAPMAGIPAGPPGKTEESGPAPSQLRVEFSRTGDGPVTVLVGDPEAPGLSMTLTRSALDAAPDAALFTAGDDKTVELLPILREQMAAMGSMGGPPGR